MDKINTIRRVLGKGAEFILAALLFSMFVTFLLQIFFRYFTNMPMGWTVEWVTIAWLWGILFGFAFVVRDSDIIRLDVLYAALPRGARRVMDVITGLTLAAIFLYTLPACWDYLTFMMREKTAYIRIPFFWVFVIYIPFAISVALRGLISAYAGLSGSGRLFNTAENPEGHDYD
ncbi:MAG: TRAP transporter small permease [Maritimibacter sp.]